jgi:hypothetical protein
MPVPTAANKWLGYARQPFVCPAYFQKFGTNTPGRNGSYTVQTSIFRNGVETKFTGPFGLISSSISQPVKLPSISPSDMGNTNYWAVSDLDASTNAQGRVLSGSTLEKTPIHVTYRNQLFFDMHVAHSPFP